MAANADIGVAKADFFPNFPLTATGGLESYALNRFFSFPSAGLYNAVAIGDRHDLPGRSSPRRRQIEPGARTADAAGLSADDQGSPA